MLCVCTAAAASNSALPPTESLPQRRVIEGAHTAARSHHKQADAAVEAIADLASAIKGAMTAIVVPGSAAPVALSSSSTLRTVIQLRLTPGPPVQDALRRLQANGITKLRQLLGIPYADDAFLVWYAP